MQRFQSCSSRPFSDLADETLTALTGKLLSEYVSLVHQLTVATPKTSAAIHAACRAALGHLDALMKMAAKEPPQSVAGASQTESEAVEDLLAAARDILERHPISEE